MECFSKKSSSQFRFWNSAFGRSMILDHEKGRCKLLGHAVREWAGRGGAWARMSDF